MAVCQFFLRGYCRFGSTCRNDHPQGQEGTQNGGTSTSSSNQTWQSGNTKAPVLFSADSIERDLTLQMDKPLWPLSSYGPAKNVPLLIPNLDESPEELRVRAVTALRAGTPNDYLKYESEKISAAEQIYANARKNISGAYEQAVKQSQGSAPESTAPVSTFGGATTGSAFGAQASTSAFGKPSAFGALASTTTPPALGGSSNVFGTSTGPTSVFGSTTGPTSTFGKPAFGQPAFGSSTMPTPSAFSQPSQQTTAFGQPAKPTTAFGQPEKPSSAFGQPEKPTSAFGQSAKPASAFGQSAKPTSAFSQPQQPSAFGQTSQPQSSFIKPATGAFGSGTTSGAFGAPSPFGAAAGASNPSPFTSGSTPSGGGGAFSAFASQPSAFGVNQTSAGNTSAPTTGSAFGQPLFGQSTKPTAPAFGNTTPAQGTTTSTFGATSAFGALAQRQPGAFSAFSSNANQSGSVFGSGQAAPVSAFSSTNQAPSSFSAQPQSQPTSAFGSIQGTPQPSSVFGNLSQSAFNSPSQPAKAQSTPSKSQTSPPDFSVKVVYKPGLDKYDALLPDNYVDIIPESAKEAFKSAKFTWGNIPEWVPPKELR